MILKDLMSSEDELVGEVINNTQLLLSLMKCGRRISTFQELLYQIENEKLLILNA